MEPASDLTKITATRAIDICRGLELGQEASALLTGSLAPLAYLSVLVERGLWTDATRFLAHALPKREGVWWACLAARSTLGSHATPDQLKCLDTAEQWVYFPNESNRRPAMEAAQAAGLDNPASWASIAVFWSSGSLSPEGLPVVPPPDDLCAKAISGAVMLSAVFREPEKATDKYRQFLGQGIDIARGGTGQTG